MLVKNYSIQEPPAKIIESFAIRIKNYELKYKNSIGEEGKHRLCRYKEVLRLLQEENASANEMIVAIHHLLLGDNSNSRLYDSFYSYLRFLCNTEYTYIAATSSSAYLNEMVKLDRKYLKIIENLENQLTPFAKIKLNKIELGAITEGLFNYAQDLKPKDSEAAQILETIAISARDKINEPVSYKKLLSSAPLNSNQAASTMNILEIALAYVSYALAAVFATPITSITTHLPDDSSKKIHRFFYHKHAKNELDLATQIAFQCTS